MFLKKLVAVAAVALVSTAASAQATNNNNGLYGEIAYTATTFKVDGLSGSWNPGALRGIFGTGLNDNLAVEAMLLLGMTDTTNLGVNVKLTSGAGFYLKPRVLIGDSLELFARAGWANVNSKVGKTDARDNGGSYGLGASYSFTKSVNLNVDYMVYNSQSGSKIDGTSVGIGFKF